MSSETTSCDGCRVFVGLDDTRLVSIEATGHGLVMTIETTATIVGCPTCGVIARSKGRDRVELVDLPNFGRPTRTIWLKRRFTCPDPDCPMASFTERDDRIAPPRQSMMTRAARWATHQVGKHARSVSGVAEDLGCEWHTANAAVIAYGEALLESDDERIGPAESLGLDEVAFAKLGPRRHLEFATSIVDTGTAQLLDLVPGRTGEQAKRWIERRPEEWRDAVKWATLDLSGTYRSVFTATVPKATMVADPFHVVRHANSKVDECRRRVQNETLGHRGRKSDPLYRTRRLLTLAEERLSENGRDKLMGLLRAGDPRGEVQATWNAKEAVRELYAHADEQTATAWIDQLIVDMADETWPVEVRSLGRMLKAWRNEIVAWHRSRASNGPTEAANNLTKRVKRAAFGFRSFRNFRVRSLLYAGKPNWSLLATVTPR